MIRSLGFMHLSMLGRVRRVVDRDPDGYWFVWYPTEEQYQSWLWSGLE